MPSCPAAPLVTSKNGSVPLFGKADGVTTVWMVPPLKKRVPKPTAALELSARAETAVPRKSALARIEPVNNRFIDDLLREIGAMLAAPYEVVTTALHPRFINQSASSDRHQVRLISKAMGGPILVVDDDAKIVSLVRTYLERDGFTVTTAKDGREALHAIRQHQPVLVVLDLMLPELDGLALLRIVREDSALPVLMLSARGSAADRVYGINEGAEDYLEKPFSPAELVARFTSMLLRPGPAKPPASAENHKLI